MGQKKSAAIWRCGVVVFAIAAVVQLAIEVLHAPRVLNASMLSGTLFDGQTTRERGPTTFDVKSVPPGSPLIQAGVVAGDRLRWDAPLGRWYNAAAGERVALTVLHGDSSRRIEVTLPAALELPRHALANYVMDLASKLIALLLGIIIGWRRPRLTAFRGLAASGLLYACAFPYSAPAGAHLAWFDFLSSVSADLTPGALVLFAINYPDDKPAGWRAGMKRYYPWFFGLQVAAAVLFYARLYDGAYEPVAAWFLRMLPIVAAALFFMAIVLAWKQARGESRVRLQWILATVGTIMAVTLVGRLIFMAGFSVPTEDLNLVLNAAALAAEVGFVYAILRRRIFDFGLAVNRTLVFGIVGAILLGVFQIAHGIVSEFLHFDDKNRTVLLSAVLAVAVYLSFSQLKNVVEKIVDRVFFNDWAVSEDNLRCFVAEAKHATDAGALSRLLVAAIDRFTHGGGCALFRGQADGSYVRTESTLAGAPEQVSANDQAVLGMLAHGKSVVLRDASSAIRGEIALPMAHRGELFGFVLLGARHDREPYRPDQIEVLEFAAHEAGLDFYALDRESLVARIADERRTSETLRAQLDTAMALAKGGLLETAPAPSSD